MKIKNKLQMLSLKASGGFINSTRDWNSLEDVIKSGFKGPVAIRFKLIDRPTEMGRPVYELQKRVEELAKQGLNKSLIYFSEWTPPVWQVPYILYI